MVATNRQASALLPFMLVAGACGDDGIGDVEFNDPIATDGVATGGPSGDEADETGSDQAVEGDQCLFDPIDGLYGYRYQCAGNLALGIVMEHEFDADPFTELVELSYGPGIEGDTYEDPLVMACCPWYVTGGGAYNCDQPHARACMIDLVEQGCKSMVGRLEDYAYDAFPGLFNAARRRAVLDVAEHVRTHQGDCTAAFRDATAIATTGPACDDMHNGVDFGAMLETGVWTFDPDGAVTHVEISVAEAAWTGLYPLNEDANATRPCSSADENDGNLFLEIDPSPSTKIAHLAAGTVELQGPAARAIGAFSPASILALRGSAGTMVLENLVLHASGPAVLVVEGIEITVDAYHVRLWDPAVMSVDDDGAALVPTGGARFAISASASGHSAARTATNSTPIVITQEGEGWHTSGFTIAYAHRDESWAVVIGPAQWH